MKTTKSLNLKLQFIALAVIASVGILLGGRSYINREKQQIKNDKYAELQAISQLKADQLSPWQENPAVHAVLGETGNFEGAGYAGHLVVGYIRQVAETPWYLIVKTDVSELYAELNKRVVLIIIIGFLSVFFIGLVIVLLYHNHQRNIYKELLANTSALYQSQKEFGAILYSIGDGVITTDKEGRVKHINPVAEKLTGWPEEEARGKNIEEVFHLINEYTSKRMESPIYKVLRDGQITGSANDTLLLSKDGRRTPVSNNGAPIRDDQGHIIGIVMIFRDQTSERRQEEALRESEQQHRTLISKMQLGLAVHEVITDADGHPADYRFLYVNPAYERLTGLKYDDVKGKTVLEVLPRTEKIWIERFCRTAITGTPDSFESYAQELDKFYSVLAYRYRENEFAVIVEDITGRKQMETRLRESEERYRLISETSLDAIILAEVNGPVISANTAACEMFEMTESEMHALTDYTLFDAEDPRFNKLLERLERDGYVKGELNCFKKNGSSFPVEVSSSVFKDSRGISLTSMIIRDIAERKKTEGALRKNEETIRLLFNSTAEGIYMIDMNGEITFSNKSALSQLGYEREEEVIGKNMHRLVHHTRDDGTAFSPETCKIMNALASGNAIHADNEVFWRKDGSCFPAEYWSHPVSSNGRIIGSVITFLDVSQRMQMIRDLIAAKEKAEESDRLQSAFLANMSHEIRTPMNGILGFLELLSEPDLEEKTKKEYIDIVNKSGYRLLDTINDIIEISKIEAGAAKISFADVNVEEVMKYHYDFFSPQAAEKGLAMVMPRQVSGAEAVVSTDRHKLEGILTNLIKNALKFTETGFIEFGNYIEENWLVFYVKDSGLGISEDQVDAIFERFVQADQKLTRAHEGSGLGLSITKAHVKSLGGKISVQSEPGKGSTFFFTIPHLPIKGHDNPRK